MPTTMHYNSSSAKATESLKGKTAPAMNQAGSIDKTDESSVYFVWLDQNLFRGSLHPGFISSYRKRIILVFSQGSASSIRAPVLSFIKARHF
jgi:hypothetical protein